MRFSLPLLKKEVHLGWNLITGMEIGFPKFVPWLPTFECIVQLASLHSFFFWFYYDLLLAHLSVETSQEKWKIKWNEEEWVNKVKIWFIIKQYMIVCMYFISRSILVSSANGYEEIGSSFYGKFYFFYFRISHFEWVLSEHAWYHECSLILQVVYAF